MDRELIIRLARESGWQYADGDAGYDPLWRFAALVAAHEREECAKVCDGEANDLSCGEDWNECGGYLAKTIRSMT